MKRLKNIYTFYFLFFVLIYFFTSLPVFSQPVEPGLNEAAEDQNEGLLNQDEIDDLNRRFAEEAERPVMPRGQSGNGSTLHPMTNREPMFSTVDRNQRGYHLDTMAAVDLVGSWDQETPSATRNQFIARELEFGFFAAIDQLAEGTFYAAAHYENGEMFFEVHEAYLEFPTTFIPNTSLKLGRFFFDVGRLNTIHRHDWDFTNAPVVHRELIDTEGAEDTGIEFSILMPWNFWQELSIGVFNGKTFGHSHTEGPDKANPLYTSHLKQFFYLGNNWGTQFGFSYLRWHPDTNKYRQRHQSGLDFLVKWQRGNQRSFQWMSEIWYRETRTKSGEPWEPAPAPVETRTGLYSFLEYQFHQNWYVGYRYDFFHNPNRRFRPFEPIDREIDEMNEDLVKIDDSLAIDRPFGLDPEIEDALSERRSDGVIEHSVQLTYRPSEFSYFRGTVTRGRDIETGETDTRYYFQAMFILGMHPPHEY